MISRRWILSTALGLVLLALSPLAQGAAKSGFLLEIRAPIVMMNAFALSLQSDLATTLTVYPELHLGGKVGIIDLTLGVGIVRVGVGSEDRDEAITIINFKPALAIDVYSPGDGRVSLRALMDLNLGGAILSHHIEDITDESEGIFNVGFFLGPGVRYFFHPSFAVGAAAGYGAQFLLLLDAEDHEDDLVILQGIEAHISITGLFW